MTSEVHVKEVASTLTAVIRLRVSSGELKRVIPACCGEVWAFAKQAQLPAPGRHVALYLNGKIDLECGVEVVAPFTGNQRVVQSATPAGRVATAAHIGPYSSLGETHGAVVRWCEQNGHRLAGASWEVYGHWDDGPSRLRTDVYYLLAGQGADAG